MNKAALKAKITKALRKGIGATKKEIDELIPKALTAGKIYEAYVLGVVCNELALHEGWRLKLVGAKRVALKSSAGPINISYPHIVATKNGVHVANVWTDIEFTSMSALKSKVTKPMAFGDYHELDIAVVHPKAASRPLPSEILLAVECKNTGYQKRLLREILGIRRELSLLSADQPTAFSKWPRSVVPANPPSCIAVYSTDPAVSNYGSPGAVFGIEFIHDPL